MYKLFTGFYALDFFTHLCHIKHVKFKRILKFWVNYLDFLCHIIHLNQPTANWKVFCQYYCSNTTSHKRKYDLLKSFRSFRWYYLLFDKSCLSCKHIYLTKVIKLFFLRKPLYRHWYLSDILFEIIWRLFSQGELKWKKFTITITCWNGR